jgi:hypothetical protein
MSKSLDVPYYACSAASVTFHFQFFRFLFDYAARKDFILWLWIQMHETKQVMVDGVAAIP